MRKPKLDSTDFGILAALQGSADTNDEALGEQFACSRSAVLRRRTALEKAKVIRGYHADIDPKKVGLPTTVYTLVSLKQHGNGEVEKFARELDTMPNVVESSCLGGSWDFLLKFAVKDTRHHDALLYRILNMANVSRVRGMHVQGTPTTKRLPLDGGQLYPQDDD